MSDDWLLDITTDDHVVLGNRIRGCRDVLMHVVRQSLPGTSPHIEARQAVAALDRLRSELDCTLRVTTPRDRDPRHIADKVYYGPQRLIGSLAGYEERWNDDFAMWDLVEED